MADNENSETEYVSVINLATGESRKIKDSEARTLLGSITERVVTAEADIVTLKAAITNGAHFLGKASSEQPTGTVLEDGSHTNAVRVIATRVVPDSDPVQYEDYDKDETAAAGDFIIVSATNTTIELIWDGASWRELGSTGKLKSLAFKDSASTSYTPTGSITIDSQTVSGTINAQTFTGNEITPGGTFEGTEGTAQGKFTPAGTVSQPTFTGTEVTPTGTFTGQEGTATGKFTPSGTVSQPTFTGNQVTPTGNFTGQKLSSSGKFTPAGTVSAPTLTVTLNTDDVSVLQVTGNAETEKITFSKSSKTVATSVKTATATQPTFTGTEGNVGVEGTPSGTIAIDAFTPGGTVSKPTFTGTEGDIEAKMTPAGTLAIDKITPAGTVTKPTFTGTEGDVEAKMTPAGTLKLNKFTPTGGVSQATFTGASHTHTGSFTGNPATITVS